MDALTSPAIHCFGDQQELLLEWLALLRRTQPGIHGLGLLQKQRFVDFKFIVLIDSLMISLTRQRFVLLIGRIEEILTMSPILGLTDAT